MILKSSKFWENTLDKALQSLLIGELKVTYPSGETKIYLGKNPGPKTDIKFHTKKSLKDSLLGGSLGFCESVISGEITSSKMDKVIELGASYDSGINTYGTGYKFLKLINKINFYFKKNSLQGARKNISLHYDLGNEFYSLWLDESMTYSSAIFDNKNIELKSAQLSSAINRKNNSFSIPYCPNTGP